MKRKCSNGTGCLKTAVPRDIRNFFNGWACRLRKSRKSEPKAGKTKSDCGRSCNPTGLINMPPYTISKLARMFGLSRSALLYYDRIGLLPPSGRTGAGYRCYSEDDRERLEQICAYRQAGLTIEDIQTLQQEQKPGISVLRQRLQAIGREI